MEIVSRALQQAPGPDGLRRSRWAIIRNTYPELKSTTIKTWLEWVPEEVFGPMRWDVPISHKVRLQPDVELEVFFVALDKPKDVKKLLSLELTGVWVNEAREVPKAAIDAATGRVGRFPPMRDGGCTWSGVIMDTNSMDDDHWWYHLAEEERPASWEFFTQPGGLEGGAENRGNLPDDYYERIAEGKDDLWRNVYIHNLYGTVQDGLPVYKGSWNDRVHIADQELWPIANVPVVVTFDFGLTPSAIFLQLTPRGQLRAIDELVASSMGVRQFAENVVYPLVKEKYSKCPLYVTGDPAGVSRDYSEDTAFSILEQIFDGIAQDVRPAETNDLIPRLEAVKWFLTRMTDGDPAFLLSPKCKILRKGFNGGYQYRRLQTSGTERYTLKPDKNDYSHPHDALQYGALFHRGELVKQKFTPIKLSGSIPADTIAGY
jgi:hypothetical protein